MPSVKDLMTKEVVTIGLYKTVLEAARLMGEKMKVCLVVVDNEKPVGIVTERDLVRRALAKNLSSDAEISDIMSKPLITIDSGASLREAARLMVSNKIRRLPVVKENQLVGIIVASDFTQQLSEKSITEQILEIMTRYPSYFEEKLG